MEHIEGEAAIRAQMSAHPVKTRELVRFGQVVEEGPKWRNDQREALRKRERPHVANSRHRSGPDLGRLQSELLPQPIKHGGVGV